MLINGVIALFSIRDKDVAATRKAGLLKADGTRKQTGPQSHRL